MCGRMTQHVNLNPVFEKYQLSPETPRPNLEPRYNGSPGQDFAAVRYEDDNRTLAMIRWGFAAPWVVVVWGTGFANARSETVHEKPAFRDAFENRRCIIPASGWFEWTGPRGAKQPHWIRPKSADMFALAGIWSRCENGGEPVDTFAVLTTDVAPAIAHLHHRQPVILDEAGVEVWLDAHAATEQVLGTALKPASGAFDSWPVNRAVNNPGNNWQGLTERLAA